MEILSYAILNASEVTMEFRKEDGNIVNLRITIKNGDFKTNFVLSQNERQHIRNLLQSEKLL
ncbi:hypothetical protein [Sphingobacterium sp. BIGb0116]|uniref:hypothetical protein n=1 Tax=Sphingobacterium sp. BIGb0116 TaxID=2940619 RepID=UPI002167797D|nr:hypothetical protein [Sphingobacterium sp. BIGb0116]MCS4164482.1 hypothetical protein [Sphingobacterium sp. BIGb0116]